jgi:KAP family P-loop domain
MKFMSLKGENGGYRRMEANEIVTVLSHFKWSKYKRILIDGTWGIGKTKYVSDFKKDKRHVSYVSLFGKKDVDSIIQEIYFQIIEKAPLGIFKKVYRVLREKFKNITFRYKGFTISVPLIEDLHKSLNKELGSKGTYIIIFDDLERKHHSLKINEVLGLLDSLSKIENIKTVLIADTDQLKGKDKTTFIDYKEKSIDRTYKIEDYAANAPVEILGEEIWNVLGKIIKDLKFKNLRTFEKTYMFIKEVIQILGKDIFTDKFTKDDLYRMCFSSVFFIIEHKGEMKLLDNKNSGSEMINIYYTDSGDSGIIEYLDNYILKKSLDNGMCKNVFQHFKRWFETGSYNKEEILSIINSINTFEEKPTNFYSSEQELKDLIAYCRKYLKNLNGTEPLEDIVSTINTGFTWCEVLTIDFEINIDDILRDIKKHITNYIDLEKHFYQTGIDLWRLHIESEEAKKVIKSINEALQIEYCKQLLEKIKENFVERSFSNQSYIRELKDIIYSKLNNTIKEEVIKSLNENEYFFPVPSGKINNEIWDWCHLIKNLIIDIEQQWKVENYYTNFKNYFYNLEETKEDKLVQHRLKLFDK